ncbi:MAG: hypothetical protein ACFBSE_16705 [Prochloraceae cyanobacterium]
MEKYKTMYDRDRLAHYHQSSLRLSNTIAANQAQEVVDYLNNIHQLNTDKKQSIEALMAQLNQQSLSETDSALVELLAHSSTTLQAVTRQYQNVVELSTSINKALLIEFLVRQKNGAETNINLTNNNQPELKLLPEKSTKRKTKKLLPKGNYDVNIDNIPLQHLADTLPYRLLDGGNFIGRNTLYKILREEGIMWPHNSEIDQDFFELGYFTWQLFTMPSGYNNKLQCCTPSGWQWLCDRFSNDWNKYVI